MDRDTIVSTAVPVFGSSPSPAALTESTPPAVIARPLNPHANWRGLPDAAVVRVLERLPVLDQFRLGYLLSPRWLDIWRAIPLYLHDRQFTTLPIATEDVADAITNVLELHVGNGVQFVAVEGGGEGDPDADGGGGGNEVAAADGEDLGVIVNPGEGVVGAGALGGVGADEGVISDEDIYGNDDIPHGGYEIGRVFCFRVETTRWRLDHLDRWFAALQRGHAREVSLANLAIEGHPHLPPGIRGCTSLLGLHVFFFTVEADDIDPLVSLRGLGLYDCDVGHGLIARALHPQFQIQGLTIRHGVLDSIAVTATRLRYLQMCDNQVVGTVALDDAIQFRGLYIYPARPSRLTINRVPSLREIISLDLSSTVLEIQGIVIQAGMVEQPPQMRSVRHLHLRVNHTVMLDRVPREIEQILRSFPCLETLEIMRDDDVTGEEGFLEENDEHIYQEHNFFDGLESLNHHLKCILLCGFRGGKYELALIKAILDKIRARTQLRIKLSSRSDTAENIVNQFYSALGNFRSTTPNDAARGKHVSILSCWGDTIHEVA